MEITPEITNAFIALVAIGGLGFMAMIFAALLPLLLSGLFED